ncbi:FRIGIDA-like protein 3 [Chenopodium quinoa]|uniref:FRIGIDA-like protein n=1 Tax=Chenopodium quinoa TaxID=63459 RepID=A0A803L875_CHEQI|nr:FRIGIDA-like protein 3 [Chenopodium quinoa]XP_021733467.1 FRIGIDA-like protein 3 [Chenopodium quinoa]XP_021733468.1 FRIGIDA-like protein 3 [Chenopodium quinoa]
MEDTQSVGVLIDSATSKIQQLQKAFAELESHRAVSLNLKWKELEAHFHGLEKSLKRRFHELEDQEKEYENKTVEAQEILEKRKAAVVAKEQASLERLQEKRDAAVFAIVNAKEKQWRESCEEYSEATSESQGGTMEDTPTNSMISEITSEYTSGTAEDGSPEVQSADNGNREVTSYPELVKLCEEMDAEGLHNFISDNRKNLASMREEIPQALNAAADPACLVLDSLNNFYRGDVTNLDAKKDSSLLGLRRTCIMLMECLSILFASLDATSVSEIVSADVKARAKAIAEAWKPKLNELDMEAGSGNSLEAHAFLQLLATFYIASDFDTEELTKLVPLVSRRRQAADLCRSLGLSDKMPGVIEVLINSGRQIDAVNLASQFELTEQFPPVPLLQNYLKEAKKVLSPIKPGNASPSSPNAQNNDVNERELSALKAVLKCVEEHKLDEQFPMETLAKRVLQLEKAKADKKRATEVTKPQSKRPRATNVGFAPRVTNLAANTSPYAARLTDRYPPPQYVFDNRPYVYTAGPTDNHCPPPVLGAPAYGFPPGHGNYYANGYQYQAPPYQY